MKTQSFTFLLTAAVLIFSCENKDSPSGTEENKSDTTASVSSDSGATYKVDTSSSSIKWTGKKVTGKHNGKIKIKSGELQTKSEVLTGGTIVIDMNSITNDDLTDSESNKKLIGHLRSEDFFSVDKFPSATFEITRVDAGAGEKDAIVTGNLTIKGKTEPVSVSAKLNFNDNKLKASGKTTIDRTKWDIKYGSGKFFQNLGDKVIYDEVELEFDLEAVK
jgi:polyisoprenoid-binding protein YceI